MYRIKISDLRRLSLSGNATVKLDKAYKYQIGEIRRDGIYIKQIGIVKGKRSEIKMRETFAKMYSHIQTIKQGTILIGERRKDDLIATSTFEKKVKEGANRDKKVLGVPDQKVYRKKERKSGQSVQTKAISEE